MTHLNSTKENKNKTDLHAKKGNVIAYNASPRNGGNTAWIISKILEGAKEQNAETNLYHCNDLDIKPCRSCYGCKKNDGGCVINDDMQKLYDAIECADAIVLASPVYMGQMSATAKIFTDRLFTIFSPRFSPYFKEGNAKKRLLLSFNQGNPDPALFRSYFDYTKKMFEMLEFEVTLMQPVVGTRNGPVHDRKDLAEDLKSIGASLVLNEFPTKQQITEETL